MKMISSQRTFAKLVGVSHIISINIKICFPEVGFQINICDKADLSEDPFPLPHFLLFIMLTL
jgi:hypothetical protein